MKIPYLKIIISHDIDHLTATEHLSDLIIPKFIIRSKIEWLTGKISFAEFIKRINNLLKNKWQNIDELMLFNSQNSIPASFFIGVANGKGLSYSTQLAEKWISKITNQGFECGVHGISYNNQQDVTNEYQAFHNISKLNNFGIRMHYLRMTDNTLSYLEHAGYSYDTSEYGFKDAYKINNFWIFPLHIMDGYEIEAGKKWQSRTLAQAKEATMKKIDNVVQKNFRYLTILFHDRYFDDSFSTWKNWYIWLIDWLKQNNFEFLNYSNAIIELENNILK